MAVDNKGKQLPKGITQRGDGRYQARYMVEGKRVSIYDKDLKKLQKQLRDAIYEVDHGIHARPEKLILDTWFNTWIEEYKAPSVKENTTKLYKAIYRKHIKPTLGKKKLKDVRAEHVQKLLNKQSKDGYSNSIIELTQIILGSLFKQAVRNGILINSPIDAVVTPRRKEKKETHVLTKEEQAMFVEHVKGTEYEPMFLLALSTGLRVGELTGLTWADIDFKNEVVKVRRTLTYKGYGVFVLGSPKTLSSIRDVPLLPEVAKTLKSWRKDQLELKLALGEKWKNLGDTDNLVFTKDLGTPMDRQSVSYIIGKLVRQINKQELQRAAEENRKPRSINIFTPHTLRHTFATRALENGIPPQSSARDTRTQQHYNDT